MRKYFPDRDSKINQAYGRLGCQPPVDGIGAKQSQPPLLAHNHLGEIVTRGVSQHLADEIVLRKFPQITTEMLDDLRRVLQKQYSLLKFIDKRKVRLRHGAPFEPLVYQNVSKLPACIEKFVPRTQTPIFGLRNP